MSDGNDPSDPAAVKAAGPDWCPDHGAKIAVLATGYRFCAWCGWEPDTGTIPGNPDAPKTPES